MLVVKYSLVCGVDRELEVYFEGKLVFWEMCMTVCLKQVFAKVYCYGVLFDAGNPAPS